MEIFSISIIDLIRTGQILYILYPLRNGYMVQENSLHTLILEEQSHGVLAGSMLRAYTTLWTFLTEDARQCGCSSHTCSLCG